MLDGVMREQVTGCSWQGYVGDRMRNCLLVAASLPMFSNNALSNLHSIRSRINSYVQGQSREKNLAKLLMIYRE